MVERWLTPADPELPDRPLGVSSNGGLRPDRYRERLREAQAALAEAGHAALLVGVGPDLEWLAGYTAVGHERLNLLLIGPRGEPVFLGPRLERGAAEQAPGLADGGVRLETWEEHDDPYRRVADVLGSLTVPSTARAGASPGLLISDRLRAAFVLGLQRALPGRSWGLASAVLSPLRRIKDAEEVVLLRAAAEAADRVIEAIVRGPLIGRREAEVAAEVRRRLVDEGHDSAEFAIVAVRPQQRVARTTSRARGSLRAGEPLLLDIGGRRAGYCSDTTRTFWLAGDDGRAARTPGSWRSTWSPSMPSPPRARR